MKLYVSEEQKDAALSFFYVQHSTFFSAYRDRMLGFFREFAGDIVRVGFSGFDGIPFHTIIWNGRVWTSIPEGFSFPSLLDAALFVAKHDLDQFDGFREFLMHFSFHGVVSLDSGFSVVSV